MGLNLESRLVRSGDAVTASVEEELVMMDMKKGTYYALNLVGTHIWQILESPVSIRHLCETLTRTFDVPYERCASEVLKFLTHLEVKGLVHVVS